MKKITHECNIGIRPLGRSSVLSDVVLLEIAALKAFGKDMANLPPADTEANAKLHRQCHLRHARGAYKDKLEKIYRDLGLSV